MPEQLSQSQIDALLQRLNTGASQEVEDEVQRVKEYDFNSPKKFTKEQLKALDGLHENFARMLSSYLSGLLRDFCEIEVMQVAEQNYYDFNNALPDNSLMGIIDFVPGDKRYDDSFFILDISTSIGFLMVERLLGGVGKGYSPERDYTDIELAILNKVIVRMAEFLQESWCNYLETAMPLRSIETNPRLLQVLAPQDIVVIVMMEIKLGKISGSISACIPAECLEQVIDSFSVKYMRTAKKQDPELEAAKKEQILQELTQSDLEIKAILDTFQMRLSDIMQLQVSDIITLDKDIRSDIVVQVDNEPWFTAKLGETKMKKSVKLNHSIA